MAQKPFKIVAKNVVGYCESWSHVLNNVSEAFDSNFWPAGVRPARIVKVYRRDGDRWKLFETFTSLRDLQDKTLLWVTRTTLNAPYRGALKKVAHWPERKKH